MTFLVFLVACASIHHRFWDALRLLQASRGRSGHALLTTSFVALDGRPDHATGRVAVASDEHGMEVRTLVAPGADESEAVYVQLALEGFELGLSEEVRHHPIDEAVDVLDAEGSSMRHPRDDGLQLMVVTMLQHVVQLERERVCDECVVRLVDEADRLHDDGVVFVNAVVVVVGRRVEGGGCEGCVVAGCCEMTMSVRKEGCRSIASFVLSVESILCARSVQALSAAQAASTLCVGGAPSSFTICMVAI